MADLRRADRERPVRSGRPASARGAAVRRELIAPVSAA